MSKKIDKRYKLTCTGKGVLPKGHVVGYAYGPSIDAAWKRIQKSAGLADKYKNWFNFIEVAE
jgi:hypothetical protein